jgi:hypothetical protein
VCDLAAFQHYLVITGTHAAWLESDFHRKTSAKQRERLVLDFVTSSYSFFRTTTSSPGIQLADNFILFCVKVTSQQKSKMRSKRRYLQTLTKTSVAANSLDQTDQTLLR